MPCAMALGQAAGAAAAIAVKDGVKPENVSIEKLQRILLDHGAILD
ncbi:MAG: FAD-dependent oxidoreductase [Clostridiales bacterium]|nr:FAD-dependent oxidoreductase [Clostridiales bacterium]